MPKQTHRLYVVASRPTKVRPAPEHGESDKFQCHAQQEEILADRKWPTNSCCLALSCGASVISIPLRTIRTVHEDSPARLLVKADRTTSCRPTAITRTRTSPRLLRKLILTHEAVKFNFQNHRKSNFTSIQHPVVAGMRWPVDGSGKQALRHCFRHRV